MKLQLVRHGRPNELDVSSPSPSTVANRQQHEPICRIVRRPRQSASQDMPVISVNESGLLRPIPT